MAKKFVYRLESLLQLRQQNTRIAKTEFALALNERANKEKQINDLIEYKNELNSVNLQSLKITDLIYLQSHKQSIVELTKQLEEQKNILLEKERIKQQKYLIALQEEKVLTKLKDKKIEEHIRKLNKEEQIQLDEIALKTKSIT